jgi:hypothetical protein
MSTIDNDYNSALSAAGVRAKKIYLRTHAAVYELNSNAVKKALLGWSHHHPDLVLEKHGKKILQMYQGDWTHFPVTERFPKSIQVGSKEADIVLYVSLDVTKISSSTTLANEIKHRQFPAKNDMRHYKAMLATSKKTGLPKSFQTDLTKHDHRELTYRSPELPVGWILRDSGTNLVFPELDVEVTNNKHASPSAWVKIMEGSYGLSGTKFYTWDGVALHEKTPSAWGEWIDGKHRQMNK